MSYLGTSGPALGVRERRLYEHRGLNDRMGIGTGACTEGHHHRGMHRGASSQGHAQRGIITGACTEGHHHRDIKTEAPIYRTRCEHRALYSNTNNTHTLARQMGDRHGREKQFRKLLRQIGDMGMTTQA